MEEWITGIGLDVGTSTTKFVVSRLLVSSRGAGSVWSESRIIERRIMYESTVHATPLADPQTIDASALKRLLDAEIGKAGIDRGAVKAGAVILTGETAAKANAEDMVHWLSDEAGSFVSATAGPDLEAILAGFGSGAERRSRAIHGTVANIDVGGGTSNIVFFRDGAVKATVNFHVGGRLIRINGSGKILDIADSLKPWLAVKGWKVSPGQTIGMEELRKLTQAMSETMTSALSGKAAGNAEADALCIGRLPDHLPPIDEVMISGGVAEFLKHPPPESLADAAVYGDIGPVLAGALGEAIRKHPWTISAADETVRATVIGAGTQSLELSGSTVHTDEGTLPLRNVPVLPFGLGCPDGWEELVEGAVETGFRLYGLEGTAPFAAALTVPELLTYAELRKLADVLAAALRSRLQEKQIAVIVMERDLAKALGQLLRLRLGGRPRIVCIDGVKPGLGDYIDIGEPVAGGAVPVILKTLVFPGQLTEVKP